MSKRLRITKRLLMLIFNISLDLIGISSFIAGIIIAPITENQLYMLLGFTICVVCIWISDPSHQWYMIKYELMSETEQQAELERIKKRYYEQLEKERDAMAKMKAFCSAVKGIR